MNNKGQGLVIGLLLLVMAILVLAAMIPAFNSSFNLMKQSNSLNCPGYTHATNAALSYNASLSSDSISCTAVGLGIPFIVLVVIVGGVMAVLSGRAPGTESGGVI